MKIICLLIASAAAAGLRVGGPTNDGERKLSFDKMDMDGGKIPPRIANLRGDNRGLIRVTSNPSSNIAVISEVKNGTDNSVNLFASGSKKGGDERKWTAVSSLSPYPGFTGDPVEGGVELSFHNNAVNISYQLKNIDRQCSNPDKATPNSCGIHIHEGKSCDDATKVGGHYYNKDLLTTDPWAAIMYGNEAVKQFEKDGGLFGGVNNLFFRTAVGRSKPIEIGFTFDETVGRTVVLHNYKGNRVTCNVIPSANWAKAHAIKDGAIAKINEKKKAVKDAIQKKVVCLACPSCPGCST